MAQDVTETLKRADGPPLAFRRNAGAGPAIVWCGGFKSDLTGTKAAALHAWAETNSRAFVRFDYVGHGASGGSFEAEGCISQWRADALAVIDTLTEGPIVLVGSSMGGWVALLAALARPERVKALVLIAPAPDFTERLLWPELGFAERRQIMETGRWARPSAYGDGDYIITRKLIEDGQNWLLLDKPIPFAGPVRILQGQDDPDVPWRSVLLLAEQVESPDVRITFVKDGDHRLSRDQDIALLLETVAQLTP